MWFDAEVCAANIGSMDTAVCEEFEKDSMT